LHFGHLQGEINGSFQSDIYFFILFDNYFVCFLPSIEKVKIVLEIKNIRKSFSSNCVLDDISCNFSKGKIIALLGQNGSGKTTFLKCLGNIMNIDSGQIDYNNSNFIFINDKPNIFGDLTIYENLRYILSIYNQKFDSDKYQKSIKDLGLKSMQSIPLKHLSAGNIQRNKILIALNTNWEYLLIDEPFSNLDKEGSIIVKEIFSDLKNQNKTILFSTHNFIHISDICDMSFQIKGGKFSNHD
tara:strand:+ start:992 stop:1717 length:726 start_codon:yes stop_codon:yes gene_type:complete